MVRRPTAEYPSPPAPLPQGARGEEAHPPHSLTQERVAQKIFLPSPLAGEGPGVRGLALATAPRLFVASHLAAARWTNFLPLLKKNGPTRRTKKLWSAGSTWSTVLYGLD
jgi:hypothetical protein